jgi:hypothetical protein
MSSGGKSANNDGKEKSTYFTDSAGFNNNCLKSAVLKWENSKFKRLN